MFVHGEEHFCEGMKAWSCAAAPIRDPVDQSIIGAINLSGLTSIFQKHNAAFAATAAREIEIALEREQSLLNMRLLEAIIGSVPMQSDGFGEGIAVVDRFGRLIFNRNCESVPQLASAGVAIKAGSKLLDLRAGLSEESILSALPADHACQEIRLITVDGAVKGAALVFKPARNAAVRPGTTPLPGVIIPGCDLKIVGQSPAIHEALDAANRMAAANTAILIEGQTGVGKQLFARLIFSKMNPGGLGSFAPINCGAISQAILEQGLAAQRPVPLGKGRIALSPVLVFDEIGELPAAFQTYLLHVLEKTGTDGTEPDNPADMLRAISLTNRVMLDEIAAGRFRHDLFYRLGAITLKIPRLRDRGEDILLIAEHYNRKISVDTGRAPLVLRAEVQEALMTHDWPGNVRELRNVIVGLHAMAKDRTVTLTDLPRDVVMRPTAALTEIEPATTDGVGETPVSLKDAESTMIRAALVAQRGNLSRVASVLGISRPTLYRKIQTYGIVVGDHD